MRTSSGVFLFLLLPLTSIQRKPPILISTHQGSLFLMATAAANAAPEAKDGKHKRRVELRTANLAAWDRGASPGMLDSPLDLE